MSDTFKELDNLFPEEEIIVTPAPPKKENEKKRPLLEIDVANYRKLHRFAKEKDMKMGEALNAIVTGFLDRVKFQEPVLPE